MFHAVYVCVQCAAYLPVLFCHLCPNNGYLGASLLIRLPLVLAMYAVEEDESQAHGSGQAGSTQEALSRILLPSFSDEGTLSKWLSWLIIKPHYHFTLPLKVESCFLSCSPSSLCATGLLFSPTHSLEQLGNRLKRSPLVLVYYASCPQHLEASPLSVRSVSVLASPGTGGNGRQSSRTRHGD